MVVDDGQDLQVFNDHDGGDLFDIGFRRGDHDVFGHQLLTGLIEEVFKFLDVLTNAVGIHFLPMKGRRGT